MKIMKYMRIAKTVTLSMGLLLAATATRAQSPTDVIKQVEKHHFQKAISSIKTILAKEPNNATAYYEMGGIYLENGLRDSAKYFYEKGISVNANEPLSYVGMGRYYLENDDKGKAKEQFEKALSMGSKNAYVMQQIADAYVDRIVTEEGKKAVELAEKATTLDRKNLSYIITLGDAYRLIPGESVKGLEQYRAAADMDKSYAPAYFRQAQLYYKVKNTAEGEKYMNQAIAADASYAPIYMELAGQNFDQRNPDNSKAIDYYKKYIELAGFAPHAHIILGSYYFADKKYAEAIAELNKAAKYNPEAGLVLRLIPYSNYYLKNYKESEEGFQKYFSTAKPDFIIGQDYLHYGLLLAATGKDSLAIINYKKVLDIDSSVYEIYDTLNSVYTRMKKYDDAAGILEAKLKRQKAKGAKINPQDYYTVALNYYKAEKYDLADTNLAQVNIYYPTWIGGYKFRALTNIKLDPKSEKGLAKPYWEKVIQLGEADKSANKKDLDDAYNYMAEYHYNRKAYGLTMCYANKMLQLDANSAKAKKLLGYLPKETKEECPQTN
jgi:tetratricopeptide (TPR) repeat protein